MEEKGLFLCDQKTHGRGRPLAVKKQSPGRYFETRQSRQANVAPTLSLTTIISFNVKQLFRCHAEIVSAFYSMKDAQIRRSEKDNMAVQNPKVRERFEYRPY